MEFYDEESVPQALSMSGQVLHGQQIVTWKTDAERLSSSSAIANQR